MINYWRQRKICKNFTGPVINRFIIRCPKINLVPNDILEGVLGRGEVCVWVVAAQQIRKGPRLLFFRVGPHLYLAYRASKAKLSMGKTVRAMGGKGENPVCLGIHRAWKLTIRLMNETPGPGGWGEKLVRNGEKESFLPETEQLPEMRTGTRRGWSFWETGREWGARERVLGGSQKDILSGRFLDFIWQAWVVLYCHY